MRRTLVLSAVVLFGGLLTWTQAASEAAGQTPAAFDPANFVGTVTPSPTTDIRMNRYTFSPGARTNWHSHQAGQVLFAEKGRLRVQEKGHATRELAEGATLHTAANVTHWHGSFPDQSVTQVSLSFGVTNWMEKVSDEDYRRR